MAERPVFFFDIDNCLYPKSKNVHHYMTELIDQYLINHLELSQEDAFKLHQEYNTTYGLAIEGLVRHNKIDPLEYNSQVDDALPLDSIIFPDPQLRKLLQDVDTTKVKLWLFTNAYKTHGNRVVELLGVEDLFEGMTFCDYAQAPLICKPQPLMFAKAMREAGVKNHKDCYFIDDSATNCRKSEALGWTAIHLVEDGESLPTRQACRYSVRSLEELRTLFPKFFKTS